MTRVRSIRLGGLLYLTNARPEALKLNCEECEFDIIKSDYHS